MRGSLRDRRIVAVLAATALAAVVIGTTSSATATPAQDQEEGEIRQTSDPVPGQYIVKLTGVPKEEVQARADELAGEHGGDVFEVYDTAIRGFAVEMSEDDARALAAEPNVAFVEEDGEVRAIATQNPATWGLDRIDQRDLPLNSTYNYNATGAGVDAYIIDTGIRTSHTDFSGRASVGTDTIGDGQNGQDCHGHGTHVAGTVGGETWGVAKDVDLIAVRVLNCQGSGSNSGVIAGVDWVTANRSGPSVANMSLGGGASTALDTAVANSISAGVTYALAAGNENTNACNGSPGRTPSGITVGSTTSTDARSSFSNFGTCVDIFAPGSSITSAWNTSNTATNTISGTSMATPHVAGAVAVYLQNNTGASPAAVTTALVNASTLNKVTDPGTGSPNRLLFSQSAPPTTGNITTVVDAAPDAPQDFSFTGCSALGCGPFTLDDDGAPPMNRSKVYENLPPGTYTITQGAAPGWNLTNLTCTNGESVNLGERRATVTLEAGDNTTCTFTNRAPGITIVADTVPDSSQDVSFTGCSVFGCGPFSLDDDSDPTLPRASAYGPAPLGVYSVTQAALANHDTTVSCDTGESIDQANRRATITVSDGEQVTCTFTNTVQSNDLFANAQVISGNSGNASGNSTNATKESGEPNHAGNSGGRSVWYRWTAPKNGTVTIDTQGSNFDTLLAVYTGSAVNALSGVASNDDISWPINPASRVTFAVTSGTTYQIAVDGYAGANGNVTLNWNLP